MKSFPRGLAVVCLALVASAAAAACGGGLTVNYEGTRGAKRAKTDVPVYDVDCQDIIQTKLDCTYQGGPLAWRALGIFRIPTKANGNWGRFRVKVVESAAAAGCPAIALRKIPPSNNDGTAIGAFCVDTNIIEMPGGPQQQQGGIGISVSASATYTPPTIECNGPSDCPPGMKCTRGTCAP